MKVHYDKEEDILLISLSDKKIDDSYETENSIVSISENGDPVSLEIFEASKFLKNLGRAIPRDIQKQVWAYPL